MPAHTIRRPEIAVEDKPDSLSSEALKKSVGTAILHSACMFAGGRTETTLNQVKVPGIEMWWVPNDGLHFKVRTQTGIVPAANVKVVYFTEFK